MCNGQGAGLSLGTAGKGEVGLGEAMLLTVQQDILKIKLIMYSIFQKIPNAADVYLGLNCSSHIAYSSVDLLVCKDRIFTPKR